MPEVEKSARRSAHRFQHVHSVNGPIFLTIWCYPKKNPRKIIPITSPQIVSLSSLVPHLRVLGFFYRLARRELHRNRTIFHLSLHSEHVQNCHMRGDGLWPTDFRIFVNSCAGYFSLVCHCVAHDVILTRVSPHVKRINDQGRIRGP